MATVPDESTMLSAIAPMVAAGVSVHWLHPRSKRPMGDDWQNKPNHTLETLTSAYVARANVGIRPGERSLTASGYLHLIDLDIRDAAQADDAWAALLEKWPEARSAPFVISGSGGESRHIYFFTDKPFRSHKIAKSAGWKMVWDAKKERDVKKYDWEIEVFGSPKQAVLPPSLHPETGESYRWGREIDWNLVEMGVFSAIPSEKVTEWGARTDDLALDDDDDLFAMVKGAPMGLTEAEIAQTMVDLPPMWVDDHDQWVQVGMALHHEYEGGQNGFERWCEWAKQSAKFDLKEHVTRWKSFKDTKRNPVRMATLIKAAGVNRLERDHDGDLADLLGDDDTTLPGTALALIPGDLDDLLGESPAVSTTSFDMDDLLGGDTPSIKPGALGPVDPEWRSYLQITEKGEIKATLHNVEMIVRNDVRTRGVMAFNAFTQDIVQVATPKPFTLKKKSPKPVRQLDSHFWQVRDRVNGDLWSDSHDIDLRLMLEAPSRQGGYSLKSSDRDVRGAINKAAHLNQFHPVRNYLDSLVWDGENRIARLFVDYVGATDNEYHREAGLLFMLGAVTRIYEPGHKFDFVPILEGFQGKRKSTFINILARHWFSELEGDFHDTKAMVEKMQGAWILEIPELTQFSKAEVTLIKGFISRTTDKVRMAYERRAAEFRRQCVFIGSTNENEYLRDSSGGRRFWPIECTVEEIDTDRLALNVAQLWAEAKALYVAWRARDPHGMLPLYMKNPIAAAYAKEMQESRRQHGIDDVQAGRIEAWLAAPLGSDLGDLDDVAEEDLRYHEEVCLIQIWVELMDKDANAYTDRDQQSLSRAMRKIEGWEAAGRKITRYGRQRVYRKVG